MERVEIIIEHFTFLLYQNVCRSLFERHKLLFAFLLAARINLDKGIIKMNEYNFLLIGGKIEEVTALFYINFSQFQLMPLFGGASKILFRKWKIRSRSGYLSECGLTCNN